MKLNFLRILILCGLLATVGPPASASALGDEPVLPASAENQVESLDLSEVEKFIQQVDRESGQYLPEISVNKILADLRQGRLGFGFREILEGLARYLFRELLAGSSLLGKIVILAVACAVLNSLQSAFEQGTISRLARGVAYLVLVTMALSSFTLAINTGREAIDNMVSFVQALLPVVLTLMAAVGGFASAAILHPLVLVALSVLSTLIKNVIFPLIYFAAVLGIVSQISERFRVSNLAKLMKESSLVLLGLFLTIFIGVLAIEGVAGSVADGVALRTAKFLTGSFVPVVGGMLADAVEALAGTSLLLKNAVGIAGILIIFALTAFPAIKILALAIIFKLASALVQPFGDSQMAEALEAMGSALTVVFSAVVAVGLMFFIALGIIVGLGNMTVMLR